MSNFCSDSIFREKKMLTSVRALVKRIIKGNIILKSVYFTF